MTSQLKKDANMNTTLMTMGQAPVTMSSRDARVGPDGHILFKTFDSSRFSPEAFAEMAFGLLDKHFADACALELADYLLDAVGAVAIAEDLYADSEQKTAIWEFMEATKKIALNYVVFFSRYPDARIRIEGALSMARFAHLGYMFAGYGGFDQGECRGRLVGTASTYIVKSQVSGLIKIGRSINPLARIKSLETGAGGPLEVLAIFAGDRERQLHQEFAAVRVFGEWFCDDGRIADYIATQEAA